MIIAAAPDVTVPNVLVHGAIHIRFGAAVLSARSARFTKRYAAASATLMLGAGCLASVHEYHHSYPGAYAWWALGVYLSISTAAQVLSVLPRIQVSAR